MSRRYLFFLIVLPLTASLLTAAANFYGPAREWFRQFGRSNERKVLGIATGALGPDRQKLTVVKVQMGGRIYLEIYTWDEKLKNTRFHDRIALTENRDGYFMLQGNTTNLALMDVDGDNFVEILTANFDKDLIPRLRMFRWNRSAETFEPLDSKYWPQ